MSNLQLSEELAHRLQQLCMASKDVEICGILGMPETQQDQSTLTAAFPLRNRSRIKDSFAVDVEDFLQVEEQMRAQGLTPAVLYHSHPRGDTEPSSRDLKLPDLTSLSGVIVSLRAGELAYHFFSSADSR